MWMVVVVRGPGRLATGDVSDGCKGVGAQVLAHVPSCQVPDGQQHTLSVVVTGSILVWLSKVAERDRSVDSGDDLRESNLIGGLSEHISASDAAFRLDESGTLQGEEDLLEIWLGKRSPLGDVAHRGRASLVLMECERK
jgi:hypothetical protein